MVYVIFPMAHKSFYLYIFCQFVFTKYDIISEIVFIILIKMPFKTIYHYIVPEVLMKRNLYSKCGNFTVYIYLVTIHYYNLHLHAVIEKIEHTLMKSNLMS